MEPIQPQNNLKFFFITIFAALVAGFVGAYVFINYGQNFISITGDRDNKDNVVTLIQDDTNKVLRVTEDSATIDIVNTVSPSVVSINIKKDVNARGSNLFIDPFFDQFFYTPPSGDRTTEPDIQIVGGGSGFIISEDGYILTNRHVIEDEDAQYSVVLSDGSEHEAEVVGKDLFLDIGVLKIDVDNLPVVVLGDSSDLQIGQTVVAIGNALAQFSNTVTKGVVSGIGRSIVASGAGSSERLDDVIQTDAAINPGNSGGPLLNLAGEVVGINSAVSERGQSIGFAIPINSVKKVIETVLDFGEIVRPYLGVRYVLLNDEVISMNNLTVDHGALIIKGSDGQSAVLPDSPAAKAGLRENDIILKVDGIDVTEAQTLAQLIAANDPGDSIPLEVLRDDDIITITVTLEKYNSGE